MQYPDTPTTHLTEDIMMLVLSESPGLPVLTRARLFMKIYTFLLQQDITDEAPKVAPAQITPECLKEAVRKTHNNNHKFRRPSNN